MADMLTINGTEVPLEIESGASVEHPEEHIDRRRSFAFELVEGTRGEHEGRVWRGTTPILSPSDAIAYKGLVKGLGSFVSLDDDMLSSRGLAPKSGSTYTYNAGGYATVVFGDTLTYAAGITGKWTLVAYINFGSGVEGIALTSSGAAYASGAVADGAATAVIEAALAVSGNGDVVVTGDGFDVYGLAWLPYEATAEMLTDWSADAADFSELGFLLATGDMLDGDLIEVRGSVREEPFVPCVVDGTWYQNARRLVFELYENRVVTLAGVSAPTISYASANTMIGASFSLSPTSTGTTSYALTSGTLPAGLTLNTSTGVISGTPTTEETASGLVVTATGSGGSTASAAFSIQVYVAITISYAPAEATQDSAYTTSPTTAGIITSYALATGTLPTGLTLNTSTGAIAGTPTVEETQAGISVTATGPGGSTESAAFSITITAASAATPPGTPSLWYDGSDIDGDGTNNSAYTDGDPIGTWVDKGSLGVNATQATASAKPTYDAAGGPGSEDALTFDGGDRLVTAAFGTAMTQPNMTALVARWADPSDKYALEGIAAGNRHGTLVGSAGNDSIRHVAGASFDTGVLYFTMNTWHSVATVFDGASSTSLVSGTPTSGNVGAHTLTGLTIGSYVTGSNGLIGAIADVLVYDTPATDTDVETYFETKHAVTFPVAP